MSPSVFEDVLYAQCWEDPQIDRIAFGLSPTSSVLSVTSGGCNVLAFLIDDPRRVIALDLNPCQNHLLELKVEAVRALDHGGLLSFVGARPSASRLRTYRALRSSLSKPARRFWDARPARIEAGLLHAGRYEGYLRLLRTWVTRMLGRATVEAFFALDDPAERERLFRRRWDGARWRLLTDLLLSRRLMTLLFDAAFFRWVAEEEDFGASFRERVAHALTHLPPRSNPFLSYILRGGFPDDLSLPLWLRPEHHEALRERLERIEIVTASGLDWMRAQPSDSVTHFNFTNIFEWMDDAAFHALLEETARVGTDGAVLTYRNLLVPRSRPESLRACLVSHDALARTLHAQDLSFIYRRYVVETVRKGAVAWAC